MGVIKARITALKTSTVAAPTVTNFVVRGVRIVGIMLDIPTGFQGATYGTITTGFALWIGTEQVWPTYGQWMVLDNFHAFIPFRKKLDKYDKDAAIRAYTTDANNDHTAEMVIITEDKND